MNEWLFTLRKMKDGLIPADKYIDIPQNIRLVLTNIAETFDPSSNRITSAIPLSIKHQITARFKGQAEDIYHRLLKLDSIGNKG
jgi:hypothetical protein